VHGKSVCCPWTVRLKAKRFEVQCGSMSTMSVADWDKRAAAAAGAAARRR